MSNASDSQASQEPLPRSPELMRPSDTLLLVIDVQERLLAAQPDAKHVVWNCRRLLDAASILGVRVAATEQVPDKLGPTVATLSKRLPASPLAKEAFSCGACGEVMGSLESTGVSRLLLCGIETHVCVQQTAYDLLAAGYQVLIAVDAVGSRYAVDHETALRRMEASGALLTTTEAAMFEWCERAGTDAFRGVSKLAKERPEENPEDQS